MSLMSISDSKKARITVRKDHHLSASLARLRNLVDHTIQRRLDRNLAGGMIPKGIKLPLPSHKDLRPGDSPPDHLGQIPVIQSQANDVDPWRRLLL